MKPKARIIQIAGLRGMLLVVFVISCLVAGFVGFPALAAMYGWNYLAAQFAIPSINFLQGILLWALIAGSIYLVNDKKRYISSFQVKTPYRMSEEDLRRIIDIARFQANERIIRANMLSQDELKKNAANLMTTNMNNGTAENSQEKVENIQK